MHRDFMNGSAAVVAGAAGLFVLFVVKDTFQGFDYGGGVRLSWSADSRVFWTQLGLAACAALLAAFSIWRIRRDANSIAHGIEWIGVAVAGIGALSLAVAQVGFGVAGPIDALERRELLYDALGIAGVLVGGIAAVTAAAETGDLDTGA